MHLRWSYVPGHRSHGMHFQLGVTGTSAYFGTIFMGPHNFFPNKPDVGIAYETFLRSGTSKVPPGQTPTFYIWTVHGAFCPHCPEKVDSPFHKTVCIRGGTVRACLHLDNVRWRQDRVHDACRPVDIYTKAWPLCS